MACGIASLVMCLSMVPVSANAATTYLKGDVNGNGTVEATDLTNLNQFLLGIKSADGATAERLDVNRDYIIDQNDVDIVKKIVLGTTSTSTVTSVNTTALPAQEDRTYYVYKASTGNMVNSYTLNKSSVSQITSNSISAYSIVGGIDERTNENGLKGVVKLSYSYDGNTYKATGTVVDAHTILTAAHCICKGNSFKSVTNMSISFYDDYDTI